MLLVNMKVAGGKIEAANIDIERVASVYSGKLGCACGCRGKYSYAPQHRIWAEKNRGYRIDDAEVSEKSVATIISKVERLIALGAEGIEVEVSSNDDEAVISVETSTRLYMVRFKGWDHG